MFRAPCNPPSVTSPLPRPLTFHHASAMIVAMAKRKVLIAYQLFIGAKNNSPNAIFKPRDITTLHKTLKRYFNGYTVEDGQGYWSPKKGQEFWEHCKKITILVDEQSEGRKLEGFTNQIKAHLGQLAVAQIRLGQAAFV
jgi:hypothetical protein